MLRFVMVTIAFMALGLAPAALQAADPITASFDCSKAATPSERTICSDPALALEDRDMAALFKAAQVSAWGKGPSNQLSVQREWISRRDSCSGPKVEDIKGCLLMAYRQRNGDLAVAALFTSPELATAVLKRVKPGISGLYQAIARYTQIGPGRDAQLDALLLPYWTMLQSGDWGYGQSILADAIKRPADITRSDADFGQFVYVVSAYLGDDEEIVSHPFPCAALVRRPDLISAISPVFGSTFDNFATYSDCETTLPPQPRLDALISQLTMIDPDDEQGTIRFSLYKLVALEQDSARLGLEPDAGNPRPIPGKLAKAANAAIAELADQYWRYGGMGKQLALRRARYWVADLANYRIAARE